MLNNFLKYFYHFISNSHSAILQSEQSSNYLLKKIAVPSDSTELIWSFHPFMVLYVPLLHVRIHMFLPFQETRSQSLPKYSFKSSSLKTCVNWCNFQFQLLLYLFFCPTVIKIVVMLMQNHHVDRASKYIIVSTYTNLTR
jgi:hypothetical protein